MSQLNRQHAILKRLRELGGNMSVQALIEELKVSPATIRRDIHQLESDGRIIRTHGGIVDPWLAREEPSLPRKKSLAVDEKEAIATTAIRQVQAGMHIFIDAGSTCLALGKRLLGMEGLTIYTHSQAIAALPAPATAKLVVLGGELRPVSGAFVGPLTERWLGELQFDIAFLAASGLSLSEGLYTTEMLEGGLKKLATERARKRILLADTSKLEQVAAIRFANWSSIDQWILAPQLPQPTKRQFRRLNSNTQLVYAK